MIIYVITTITNNNINIKYYLSILTLINDNLCNNNNY